MRNEEDNQVLLVLWKVSCWAGGIGWERLDRHGRHCFLGFFWRGELLLKIFVMYWVAKLILGLFQKMEKKFFYKFEGDNSLPN